MINKATMAALAAGAVFAATPAAAQSVGMATAKQGSYTYSAGAAIAKIASDNGLSMRIQPFSGTTAYVPVLGKGEIQFGLANQLTTYYAVKGMAMFKGKAQPNLRVVTVMVPFGGAFFVKKDSPIKTIADLKGKRVPARFTSARVLHILVEGSLANGGLKYSDVKQVPVTTVPSNADAYARGQTDAFFFAIGAAKVREVDAKLGGLRALPYDPSPKAVAAMQKFVPVAVVANYKPRKGLAGFPVETPAMQYAYLVLTNSKVKDEDVYKLAKVMHANKKGLMAGFRPLAGFNPAKMYRDMPELTYHPGAVKFLKETKQWPAK
ncbi:MAG: TAXI family TRAP transporter solute-binding subunit [Hyphomicrobiales bacterium]|nr:TAXI family TRAP transporter solute-binding subunit [Hyphomicrobiales bacterium]